MPMFLSSIPQTPVSYTHLDVYKRQEYTYRDYGSLVNLGRYTTVGNLMGSISGGSLFIEGLVARVMYQSLYQMHLMALHGFWCTGLQTLARIISRRTEAHVKLH